MFYYIVQYEQTAEDERLVDWVGPYRTEQQAQIDCEVINTVEPIPDPLWRVHIDNSIWPENKGLMEICLDPEACLDLYDTNVCHCNKPVHVYEDGFTRGLCQWCSDVRCDLPVEEGYTRDCVTQVEKKISKD